MLVLSPKTGGTGEGPGTRWWHTNGNLVCARNAEIFAEFARICQRPVWKLATLYPFASCSSSVRCFFTLTQRASKIDPWWCLFFESDLRDALGISGYQARNSCLLLITWSDRVTHIRWLRINTSFRWMSGSKTPMTHFFSLLFKRFCRFCRSGIEARTFWQTLVFL